MEDVAGLAHFDHEGRLPAREVVAGADAGEDAVDRAEFRLRRRDEAADVREQHDQCVLAHVRRLAAHVRTRDHEHASSALAIVAVQPQIVRLERFVAHRFHHRMAAAFDVQPCVVDQCRPGPVEFARAFGEAAQHVEFAQRTRGALQWFEVAVEFVENAFVQQLLARQRTLARRQHFVLELFQLFGDVALGAGQGLASGVVDRRFHGLALADLDVIAVDAVVADLERGDAAARPLAGFQIDQELVGMRAEHAQFVQFGIETIGDHAAVARQQRRLLHDGACHPCGLRVVFAKFGAQRQQPRRVDAGQRLADLRQQQQRIAQGREIARSRAAQGHARQDAFDVAEAAEGVADIMVCARREQLLHCVMTLADDPAFAQRPMQPAAQQAAAHRRDGAVEHAEQGVPGVAIDAGVEFQMAAGGRVHRDRAVAGLDADRGEVRQPLFLGFLDVAQQRAGRSDGQWLALDAETGEVEQIEELQQLPAAAVGVEQPRRASAHAASVGQRCRPTVFVGN